MTQDEQLQLRSRAIGAGLVFGALFGMLVGYFIDNYAAGIGTCMTVGAVAGSIGARLKLQRATRDQSPQ